MPDQLSQLSQDRITHVHSKAVIDDVQLIGIYIECGPMSGTLGVSDNRAHALFKRRSRIEPAQRVIAALDDSNGLARKYLGQARVPVTKVIAYFLAEECQHAHGF